MPASPGTVFLASSTDGFFTKAAARDVVTIAAPRARLLPSLAALRGIEPDERLLAGGPLALPPDLARRLRAALTRLVQKGATGREADDPLDQAMLGAILKACLAAVPDRGRLARWSAARTVRRAEDCFMAAAGRRIALADLCAAAGVGASALNAAFHVITDESPLRYLHKRRLMQARAALVTATPGRAVVKQVALDVGLTQLGRFAVEYRALFGEAPSVTLSGVTGAGPADAPRAAAGPSKAP